MKTRTLAVFVVIVLGLIPVTGSAHAPSWLPEPTTAQSHNACPMLHASPCPAVAGIELSHLATAAERGCPYSTNRLIEQARRCTDEETAGLARLAASGDDEAKTELIRRIKSLMRVFPGPVNPMTAA